MRCGAQTLELLAMPLNVAILRAFASGPKRQGELRREVGSPAQSTLRSYLSALQRTGIVARQRHGGFPGGVEYDLAEAGRELLFVASVLERWLGEAPEEPLALGSDAGKAAVKALIDGWSSTMLRALAAGPLSLTQLDDLIGGLNYPSLERRLGAMRLPGLVEPVSGGGRGTPYVVTSWLRRGIGPIAAATRWERRNLPTETAPIGRIDAEAGLMLMMPLLQLPADVAGSCRLVVELGAGDKANPATVTATVADGRVTSCIARSEEAGAWAIGSPNAWLRAAIEADPDHLEIGGNGRLARSLLDAFYSALYGPRPRNISDARPA